MSGSTIMVSVGSLFFHQMSINALLFKLARNARAKAAMQLAEGELIKSRAELEGHMQPHIQEAGEEARKALVHAQVSEREIDTQMATLAVQPSSSSPFFPFPSPNH